MASGEPFTLVVGDTRPHFDVKLEEQNGTALDLEGATVTLSMYGKEGVKIDDSEMTVIDLDTASVRYTWKTADVDTAGDFRVRVKVVYVDGGIRTIPNEGHVPIRINEALS